MFNRISRLGVILRNALGGLFPTPTISIFGLILEDKTQQELQETVVEQNITSRSVKKDLERVANLGILLLEDGLPISLELQADPFLNLDKSSVFLNPQNKYKEDVRVKSNVNWKVE